MDNSSPVFNLSTNLSTTSPHIHILNKEIALSLPLFPLFYKMQLNYLSNVDKEIISLIS